MSAAVIIGFDPAVLALAGFPALSRRFLLWRTFSPRKPGGKPVKLPRTAAGYPTDGTDEQRWLDFGTAVDLAVGRRLGLGVGLGWGVCGLDLDRCRGTGAELTPAARLILRHFPTYTEVSPSEPGSRLTSLPGRASRRPLNSTPRVSNCTQADDSLR